MKKPRIVSFIAILFTGLFLNAQELPITPAELPVPATEFISKHFPTHHIQSATKDIDSSGKIEFEVKTDDFVKIEFNQMGEWKEIESNNQTGLVTTFLPEKIREYLKSNFSNQKVEKAERGLRGYEIELMNDVELKFDLKGKFISRD